MPGSSGIYLIAVQGLPNIKKSIYVIHNINRMKRKYSFDYTNRRRKKHSTKSKNPFMIQNTQQTCIKGNFLNLIKITHPKTIASIILKCEKLKCPPKIRKTTRKSSLTNFFFSIALEVVTKTIRHVKEKK